MCAHKCVSLLINLYFNIPAVLPELLILMERNGMSRTSAEGGHLSLIYLMYTKKKPKNRISQLGVAVVVFKGLSISRQTKELALLLTASFQKPGDLTAFPSPPNRSTSPHLINKTTWKGKKEKKQTKKKKSYQKQAASSLISKILQEQTQSKVSCRYFYVNCSRPMFSS